MINGVFLLTGILLPSMPLLAGPTPASSGREVPSLPLAEIRAINESRALSHARIVQELVTYVDGRLSMATATHDANKLREIASDIATLIVILAQPPYAKSELPRRRDALQQAIKRMPPAVTHENQVRRYLYLALGMAGGEVPEDLYLSFLKDPETSETILYVTLRAMSHSNVPIRALPRLLELTDHPSSVIHHTGVGPPESKRVYPIRDGVFECLQKLGIESRKTKRPPETPEERQDPGLTETIVSVDRQALLKKLEGWIESDDPALWRPAIDALRHLGGDAVSALINELLRRESLSDEKRSALKTKP